MTTEVEACLQLMLDDDLVVTRVPSVNGFACEVSVVGGPVKYQMFTVGDSTFLAYRKDALTQWGASIKLRGPIAPVVSDYADLARFARKFFNTAR